MRVKFEGRRQRKNRRRRRKERRMKKSDEEKVEEAVEVSNTQIINKYVKVRQQQKDTQFPTAHIASNTRTPTPHTDRNPVKMVISRIFTYSINSGGKRFMERKGYVVGKYRT